MKFPPFRNRRLEPVGQKLWTQELINAIVLVVGKLIFNVYYFGFNCLMEFENRFDENIVCCVDLIHVPMPTGRGWDRFGAV